MHALPSIHVLCFIEMESHVSTVRSESSPLVDLLFVPLQQLVSLIRFEVVSQKLTLLLFQCGNFIRYILITNKFSTHFVHLPCLM
jgi:hypothetical protein